VSTGQPEGAIVANGSVFDLEPAAVQWLAETFDDETPQHALLDSLALSADAATTTRGMKRSDAGRDSRPLHDLLSEETVGEIVGDVATAFPNLPIPQKPGRAQLRAIDRLIRQGYRETTPIPSPSRPRSERVRNRGASGPRHRARPPTTSA